MSSLSFGAHANIVFAGHETLRVSTSGVATVVSRWGAPDGTTTLTAESQDFGPYGVNTKMTVTATSGAASYQVFVAAPDPLPSESLTAAQVAEITAGVRQVAVSRALTNADNGSRIEMTATAQTLTIPAGLIAGFHCEIIPHTLTSIAVSGGASINGAATTLDRAYATDRVLSLMARGSAVDTYVLTGTDAE
jgi:hypothetical protein